MYKTRVKYLLTGLIIFLGVSYATAQDSTRSLAVIPVNIHPVNLPKNKIRPLPYAMFATALYFRHNSLIKTNKYDLQDEIGEDIFGSFHSGADNYLQFVPSVSPLLLDLFHVPSYHNRSQRDLMMLESHLLTILSVTVMKNSFHDVRPDGKGFSSFPSGHTAFAFTGAAILDHEYGKKYPWIKWTGYGLATLVGISRLANNRHWANDIVGGAAVGIISTDLIYWLNHKKLSHSLNRVIRL